MAKTFALAVAMGTILAVHAATGVAQQTINSTPMKVPALKIGSGDLIDVNVYDSQDLSGHFRVDEKGDVTIPLIGAVHVEDETAVEAGETIGQRFVDAEILKPHNTQVTVFISEYATQGILVTGEARTPGLYPALGVRMLNDVMTAAGGVTPMASSKLIITRKSDPSHPIKVVYNPEALSPVIPQIQMFPGDTITIPSAGAVYVLGSVQRSGNYVLEGRHTLTVEKAMALAGGSIRGANLEHAHLVRMLDNGKKEDIVFNISQIYKGKAPDLALKDGDILYIPTNNAKVIIEQAITSAIAIGSTVLTYRVAYQ